MKPLAGLTVAHVTTVHHAEDTRIRTKECPALIAAGAELFLVAPDDPSTELVDAVEHVRIRRRGKFARVLFSGAEACIKTLRRRPQIVHLHDPELLAIAPIFRAFGATVIYDVHEDLPRQLQGREWLPRPVRRVLAAVSERIEPLLGRTCNGFVMVEDWTRRFPDRPTVFVANLPIRGEFTATQVRRVSEQPPQIVYVGSVTSDRGALVLVDAINQLDTRAELVLAGPLAPSTLKAEIEQRDIHDRVRLPGRVSRREVVSLLANARAAALLLKPSPAYDAARATKLFEYALAGLPMVLSDSPAHRAFCDETGAGALLVDYNSVDAVTEAMQTLLSSPATHQDLSERSASAALAFRSWEDEAVELVDFYAQLGANG